MCIPLVNLKRQFEGLENEIVYAMMTVLREARYIMGDEVQEFENKIAEYVGTKYAVSCANGTDALVLALKALGIGRGDEVITTTYTFFATAESMVSVGAIPVFVDVNVNTYNIDVTKIEEAITSKTKAIMPVHIFGQPADMDKINDIAKKYNLSVIEDACQAMGATYKGGKVGSLGDIACFSFFPTKNLGSFGDGGIITTDSEGLYKIVKGLRVHGSGFLGLDAYNEINKDKILPSMLECSAKYYNYLIGYNSRLDTLQAAILNIKLQYLDEWNNKRLDIVNYYNRNIKLKGIIKPYVLDGAYSVSHLYILQSEYRDELIKYLNDNGIATGIYYPIPLHLQKVFLNLQYKVGDLPVAEHLAYRTFAIPAGPELNMEEIKYIVDIINKFKINK